MTTTIAWDGYRVRRGDSLLLDLPDLRLTGPGLVLVLGGTGSGKTTLLRSATGLAAGLHGLEDEGRVMHPDGPHRFGYLPQDPLDAFLSFDAEHEFLLRARAQGRTLAAARGEAEARVETVGLADRARLPLLALSAGERKRLALQAIQAHDPAVLLLDEPHNHLDATWRPRMESALLAAAQARLVLVATHDALPLLPRAHRIVVLRAGAVAWDGAASGLLAVADRFPELRLEREPMPTPKRTRAGPPAIELDSVSYVAEHRPILSDVTARFGRGFHVILAPNGGGKTTLLRLLMGLERPTRGRIRVDGRDPAVEPPAAMSRSVALHFEEPANGFFAASVAEEVAFSPRNRGLDACEVETRLRTALADQDLEDLRDRHPYTLSGGERERLALACIDAARAPVVLLDEPTHGLDAEGRRRLYALIDRLAATACVLVATHDDDLAARADTRRHLAGGRLPVAMEEPLRIPS